MLLDLAPDPPTVISRANELIYFLPFGFALTILIEAPLLLVGLPRVLSWKERLFAGVWLTACTYPIVVLVLPVLFSSSSRGLYLLVAETFAPVAECMLFWLAFRSRLGPSWWTRVQSFGTITIANILSFLAGEFLISIGWFGLF